MLLERGSSVHLVPPPPERLDLRFGLTLADGLAPVRRRSADGILDVVEFADPNERFLGDRMRSGAGGQIVELAADMRPQAASWMAAGLSGWVAS